MEDLADALPDKIAPGALVGRRAELARAVRLLDGAQAGAGGALLLVGEPGVGKTRLLGEVCRIAADRGLAFARAACLPLLTALPFEPVLELLRSLRRAGETAVALPKGSRAGTEVFSRAVAALEDVASGRPLLLALDDLHFSDVATLDLVHYCVARLVDLPVVWLLASRPAQELQPLVHYLGRDRLAETLDLPAFTREETDALIRSVTEADSVSPILGESVHARSGGNAFLCEELLRTLAEGRLLTVKDGVLETATSIEVVVPQTVAEAVAERMHRLPPSAAALLQWASILPEPIERGWLDSLGTESVEADLELLAQASFLVLGEGGGRRFAHSLVRDAVHGSISAQEQQRRHSLAADLLDPALSAQRAPQLVAAGRPAEAGEVYLDLAAEALLRGGNEDAVGHCRLARSLALKAGAAGLRRGATEALALALLRTGEIEEAKAHATDLLGELHSKDAAGERLCFLSRYAVALWDDASDLTAAREALSEAEDLMPAAQGQLLAEAASAQAHILDRAGEPTRALPFAERALAVAREVGDRALELRALTSLGLIVGQARSAPDGMALLHEAVAIARDEQLPKDGALAFLDLSYLAQVSGDEEGGENYAREGLALPHVPPAMEALLRGNVALGPMNRGELDTALAYLLSAQAVASRAGPKTAERIAVQLCFVYVMRGDLEAATRTLEGIRPAPGSWEYYRTLEPRGMLLEEQGQTEAALSCYLEGGAAVDHPVAIWCLGGVVRTALSTGELETARDALARLEELGLRWPASNWLIEASRGLLAGATGNEEEGAKLLERAAEDCPEAFQAIRLRLEAARLRGDREGIMLAIEAYDTIGARRAADRARALARSLGMRPRMRKRPAGVLSEREQEIALLAASGQTNPEIAAALYLSRKTVERHVSSILDKLGLRSRVELAREVAAGRLPGVPPPG